MHIQFTEGRNKVLSGLRPFLARPLSQPFWSPIPFRARRRLDSFSSCKSATGVEQILTYLGFPHSCRASSHEYPTCLASVSKRQGTSAPLISIIHGCVIAPRSDRFAARATTPVLFVHIPVAFSVYIKQAFASVALSSYLHPILSLSPSFYPPSLLLAKHSDLTALGNYPARYLP